MTQKTAAHITPEIAPEITPDVVIVGAGLAGLTCGRYLQQQGLRTVILDKSRGVGGRVATRRIGPVSVDHGLPYLDAQGPRTQALAEHLKAAGVVAPAAGVWKGVEPEASASAGPGPHIAPQGMTAIAKVLAADLTLYRQHQVVGLHRVDGSADSGANGWTHRWRLQAATPMGDRQISAAGVVLAIPAPQARALLQPLDDAAAEALAAVTFDPCFSVMVGYAEPSKASPKASLPLGLRSPATDLRWVGFEETKRPMATSVVVLQSSPEFAQQALDWPQDAVAAHLIAAATALPLVAQLGPSQWHQVHRWRYALCRRPHPQAYLSLLPLPLVCCGDWCGGDTAEAALKSGEAAAKAIAAAVESECG